MEKFLHIRTHNRNYLQALGGGGGAVTGRGPWPREWETFSIVTDTPRPLTNGTPVQIGVWNESLFLKCTGGAVTATGTRADPATVFTLVLLDGASQLGHFGRFALRAPDGRYMSAIGGGGADLVATSTGIAQWETFTAEFHPVPAESKGILGPLRWYHTGSPVLDRAPSYTPDRQTYVNATRGLAIRCRTGYLQAISGGGGQLSAAAPWAKQWETFSVVAADRAADCLRTGAHVHLLTWNFAYLHAAGGGGGAVSAQAWWPREWETFTLELAPAQDVLAHGKPFWLRSYDGHFLAVSPAGSVTADQTARETAEPFVIEDSEMVRPYELLPPRTPIGRYYWNIGGPASWLGRPSCAYDLANPGGEYRSAWEDTQAPPGNYDARFPGRFMRYENGWLYYSPRSGVHAVHNDAVLGRWARLGAEAGVLGFPTTEENRKVLPELPDTPIIGQRFQGGEVAGTPLGAIAANARGALLPVTPYRLTLESVSCDEESDGLGADDFGFTLIAGINKLLMGTKPILEHWWHYSDFDSGEERSVDLDPLYAGELPAFILLAYLGIEMDWIGTDTEAQEDFVAAVTQQMDSYDLGGGGLAHDIGVMVSAILLGAASGLVASAVAAALGANWLTQVCVGGGVGTIGLGIGITYGIHEIWGDSDCLVYDQVTVTGQKLRDYLDSHQVPVAHEPYVLNSPLTSRSAKVRVSERWATDAATGDLLQYKTYRNDDEDSTYTLKFRHHFA